MNILTCSEHPEYTPSIALIKGETILAHMEAPIIYHDRTITLNDNWRWMYWLRLWDQYFQENRGLLLDAMQSYTCYRATPKTQCWYPTQSHPIHRYPGYDHDQDVSHLGYYSGSKGTSITTIQGTQRQPCDPAAALAYLVWCEKEEHDINYPPMILRITMDHLKS